MNLSPDTQIKTILYVIYSHKAVENLILLYFKIKYQVRDLLVLLAVKGHHTILF